LLFWGKRGSLSCSARSERGGGDGMASWHPKTRNELNLG
jgi:hypothetical protein